MLEIKFGWRSLTEYQHGFWLDKNTFVTSDKVEIRKVRRPNMLRSSEGNDEADMLILTNALGMTVDNNGKILGETMHPNFGVWLDAVNRAMALHDSKI
jgi:hypothetical protein